LVSSTGLPLSVGFPPIEDAQARVLVLGSLPGRRSLELQQYYAQPYNAFWRIMGALFGADPELSYSARSDKLRAHGIALWDVLAAGEREGSLDSSIVAATIVVNDFSAFFTGHPHIGAIFFNGTMAAQLFRRRVAPVLRPEWAAIAQQVLPSTSPAHASLRFEDKLARWAAALRPVVSLP
jgi:hypoxanthine-DNA glycosylase